MLPARLAGSTGMCGYFTSRNSSISTRIMRANMPTDIQAQAWSLVHVVDGLNGMLDRKMGVKLDRMAVEATAPSSSCRWNTALPRLVKAVADRGMKMESLASCGQRPSLQ